MKKQTRPLPLIPQKKQFGQHFLRKQSVVDHMIDAVTITKDTTIVEIGCGDGFLTHALLQTPCAQVQVFEIDPEWAAYVEKLCANPRLTVTTQDILTVDLAALRTGKRLVLLANLPYQITFPLFEQFVKHHTLFDEAVVMVQEEAAQRVVSSHGRSCGAISLYLQHSFNFKLLEKIEPGAFSPPPKVFSRLVHFSPRTDRVTIPDEQQFWLFVRACFKTPRQMLKNNLKRTPYEMAGLDEETLKLRAQQLSIGQLLAIWEQVRMARQ